MRRTVLTTLRNYHVRVLVIREKLHDHTQSTAQSNAQVSLCQNDAFPTALNNPEERIVTDRGMTSRIEKGEPMKWTSSQMCSLKPTVRATLPQGTRHYGHS